MTYLFCICLPEKVFPLCAGFSGQLLKHLVTKRFITQDPGHITPQSTSVCPLVGIGTASTPFPLESVLSPPPPPPPEQRERVTLACG
jgi:hypothetical protein